MNKIYNQIILILVFGVGLFSFTLKEGKKKGLNASLDKDTLPEFNRTFIGRHTDDNYIPTLFNCWGQVISENEN